MQALEYLGSEYFLVLDHLTAADCGEEHECWLTEVSQALELPPSLKVKWLTVHCCTVLDLSSPGDSWTLALWQRLVMCMHAIPALEALSVCLPRYTLEALRSFVEKPFRARECNLCGCTGTLSFSCTKCRYVIAACAPCQADMYSVG